MLIEKGYLEGRREAAEKVEEVEIIEKPLDKLTKAELREKLDGLGIVWDKADDKAALLALFP
ncbi:Uncharacterised protein [Chlamydia trachomatis]|nr:Uncharacterised protein [Chlamydia trachomatis]